MLSQVGAAAVQGPPRLFCGCGGIGRRAGFRYLWANARGGSTPLIRMAASFLL